MTQNRRSFLHRITASTVAASAAATATSVSLPACAGEFTGKIRTAVKYHLIAEKMPVVLGRRVAKLDVKEYDLKIAMNQGMRKAFAVPIGQGSIEWSKVRSELKGIEYEGWATAEVSGGDRQRLAEIFEQMNQVLDLK